MSELVQGSSVPLFDRLASDDGRSGASPFLLLPEHLEASIGRELSRLFNTRCRLMPSQVLEQSTGTVIDYGIPDFSALSFRHAEDVDLLEASITQAIGFYEPRLKNARAKLHPIHNRADAAVIVVSGDVAIGLKMQRVSFELNLNQPNPS